jgi:hypothetical protein
VPVHPLLTAMLVMDMLVLLLLTGAAVCAFRVVLNWSPGDTGQAQLRLQARQEAWSLATSIAVWTYLASGLLLIAILSNILPGRVPGAMCGTGVMEACRPDGYRMLLLRFLGSVGLFCWHRLETLNRGAPLAPLTAVNARVLLAILPIVCLGYGATFQALTGLDTSRPVDCCTALYDRVGPAATAEGRRLFQPSRRFVAVRRHERGAAAPRSDTRPVDTGPRFPIGSPAGARCRMAVFRHGGPRTGLGALPLRGAAPLLPLVPLFAGTPGGRIPAADFFGPGGLRGAGVVGHNPGAQPLRPPSSGRHGAGGQVLTPSHHRRYRLCAAGGGARALVALAIRDVDHQLNSAAGRRGVRLPLLFLPNRSGLI